MRVVSVVNMKGGVGKSTSVCMLAEALASQGGMRVLVVDLDPQSNASMMLAGLDQWSRLRETDRTLDAFFNQFVHGTEPRRFHEFIAPRVTDLMDEPQVDLVVATPEFRYVERDALDKFIRQGFLINAVQDRLARLTSSAIASVESRYDLVLFDYSFLIILYKFVVISL